MVVVEGMLRFVDKALTVRCSETSMAWCMRNDRWNSQYREDIKYYKNGIPLTISL